MTSIPKHNINSIHRRNSRLFDEPEIELLNPSHTRNNSEDDDNVDDDDDCQLGLSRDNNFLLKKPSRIPVESFRDRPAKSRPDPILRSVLLLIIAIRSWLARGGKSKWLYGVLFLFAIFVLIGTGNKNTSTTGIDGHSPPWYPSPNGGTTKRWEESYQKAEHLVKKMSLVEKVNVTTGTGWMNGLCVGNTAPAVHVGFPSLCLQDGPLGLRFADNVTAGPAGITVGATWNRDLMYKRGRMLGLEAKVKGINVLLGPSVGPIGRSPLGGRNWEGFGIDPVLQATAAVETINGIQDEGIMATIKHFVGNEQEHFRQPYEWGRASALSSNIGDRALHEVYAWPFADSVRAGVASVMCSYNQVNNSYACQNSKLLNGILKDELGFQGFVQSDWLAKRSGVASALAGLDMDMPGDGEHWADGKSFWGSQLTLAALNSSLPMERLNDAVTRIIATWYQFGQDDEYYWHKPPPDGDGGPNFSSWTNDEYSLLRPGSDDETTGLVNRWVDAKNIGGFSHSSLSRRIAAEGIVLLRNDDDFLPLSRHGYSQAHPPSSSENVVKIGIFGQDALANPKGPNACPDRICNDYTLAMGWGSGTAEFPHLVAPIDALRGVLHQDSVELSLWSTDESPIETHEDLVQSQDLCIVFVNADSGEGFGSVEDVHGDRNDLNLAHGGNRLIQDVAMHCGRSRRLPSDTSERQQQLNGDTIVIIHSVGPVVLESFIEHPHIKAVVWANLPGEESGTSLVDVLLGDLNPSGHLPYTIGKSLGDYGPAATIVTKSREPIPQQDFDEGILLDYKWFDSNDIEPRFEFGFGLSYTNFAIRNLVVESTLDSPEDRPDPNLTPRPPAECSPPDYSHNSPPLDPANAVFPTGWRKLKNYVYPYIDSIDDVRPGPYPIPVNDGKEIPSPAGGGEGGHPELWEVLVRVTFQVTNTGLRSGQAVPQVYIVFPDNVSETYAEPSMLSSSAGFKHEKIEFPPRQLRGFTKVHLAGKLENGEEPAAGQTKSITLELTRRDLSYWSVRQQSWIVPEGTFGIEVGLSSRDIRARQTIF